MKKLSLLFVLLISMSVVSYAQMSFGAKIGFNMANISGDIEDNSFKPGYHIGGTMNYELSDAISVQPSLILSNKGVKVENDLFTAKASLNYLEIPINGVYTISGFQIYAGPYVAFGLFGKVKFDDDNFDDMTVKFMNDIGPDDLEADEVAYKMIDIGLNVGVGYKVMDNLQVQAGYGLGLSNVTPKYDGEDPDVTNKNGVIQVSVSYFLK